MGFKKFSLSILQKKTNEEVYRKKIAVCTKLRKAFNTIALRIAKGQV